MSSSSEGADVVLGNANAVQSFNLQMLSPILLGFTAPLLAVGLIDPVGLRHGRLLFVVLLTAVLVLAAFLFLLALLWPGDLVAVVIDGRNRQLAFVHRGLLADMAVEAPFEQVASIGIEQRFDPDGYPFTQAEIRLRDGQRVPLPPGTTVSSMAAARRRLGL